MAYKMELAALKAALTMIQSCPRTKDESDESESVCSLMAYVEERLDDAIAEIEQLNKPTREGTLLENRRNRFIVAYNDGEESNDLTCGAPIELFNGEEWLRGRVEHNGDAYYFRGGRNPELAAGMRVRTRV